MSRLKKFKFGNVVLCEFVSRGETSRYTLTNIVSGDLHIRSYPREIFLSTYIEYIAMEEEDPEIKFEISINEKPIGMMIVKTKPKKMGQVGSITSQPFRIRLEEDGNICVDATADGYKKVRILKKAIIGRTVSKQSAVSKQDVPERS